jgi:LysM repeat protein
MALTEEDKKFLIKIGQELPIQIKETKKQKETPTETPTLQKEE